MDNNFVIESFIDYCDSMIIANEGSTMNRIVQGFCKMIDKIIKGFKFILRKIVEIFNRSRTKSNNNTTHKTEEPAVNDQITDTDGEIANAVYELRNIFPLINPLCDFLRKYNAFIRRKTDDSDDHTKLDTTTLNSISGKLIDILEHSEKSGTVFKRSDIVNVIAESKNKTNDLKNMISELETLYKYIEKSQNTYTPPRSTDPAEDLKVKMRGSIFNAVYKNELKKDVSEMMTLCTKIIQIITTDLNVVNKYI